MHTNVSELRLFVGIVNLYVRCFTYLFIVQTTWERPSVALDERKWQGFLDGGNYHYIRWGTYSLWSTLATLLCDLTLPEWPRSYFAPYQAWWEEDKSLKYIRLTLPLRESKTSHKKRRKLWILFVEENDLPLMFMKDSFVFSQLVSHLSLCVAHKRGSQTQQQLGCKGAPFP